MIVSGTGHRPEDCEDEKIVRTKVRNKLKNSPATSFITGMAAGFDLWAGDEALSLGLLLVCAVPWRGHQPRNVDKELYEKLLNGSFAIEHIHDEDKYPGPWVYHKRNEWMVDNSDALMAYWNGKEKGGTFACRTYAKKVGKPVANIYWDAPF